MLETGVRDAIRERVLRNDVPYIGWSAGTNVACPNMRTTNDMAIVEPSTTESIGLISGHLNAHYRDPLGIKADVREELQRALAFLGEETATRVVEEILNQGESRLDRLHEFVQVNGKPVLGLYEGSVLRVKDGKTVLHGKKGAKLVGKKSDASFEHTSYEDGADVTQILEAA